MLTNYKVREGFVVHRKKGSVHTAGEVIELDETEAKDHANQIEKETPDEDEGEEKTGEQE